MPIPPSPFRNSLHVFQILFEVSSSERPPDYGSGWSTWQISGNNIKIANNYEFLLCARVS